LIAGSIWTHSSGQHVFNAATVVINRTPRANELPRQCTTLHSRSCRTNPPDDPDVQSIGFPMKQSSDETEFLLNEGPIRRPISRLAFATVVALKTDADT